MQEAYLVGLVDDAEGLGGTCGEPCGAGVGSLEGKQVEAKQGVEIEWVSQLALYTMYLVFIKINQFTTHLF